MVIEYHFESGPISGHVLMCQFEKDPTPAEVGRRVAENLNRHFYALKDERKAEWSCAAEVICIDIMGPDGRWGEDVPYYELIDRMFVWTIIK